MNYVMLVMNEEVLSIMYLYEVFKALHLYMYKCRDP